ncbi:hypothetical protein V6N11_003990 [Hibiscus sabdariffa]|uniref:Carbohydrate kinase PfkB domain-containing protein n=1 Tax=Hibiscus sabdariffa TaxID=183260 RepID=A0ABR2SF46_9ROSI
MGAETLVKNVEAMAPLILGLQPAALIDHVARVDWSLLHQIPGERGGSILYMFVGAISGFFSHQGEINELEHILSKLKKHILASIDEPSPMKIVAGGSVANTIRGLSSGFGVNSGMIGAYGDDEQGRLFLSNMNISAVYISRLRKKKGPTAQCVCLVDADGNRTMRPCLSTAVKVEWLVMRYGIFNLEVIQAAITIAKQEGLFVSLDLASFEMVRNFRQPLQLLLESGDIDLCIANEDEATELLRGEENADPEAAIGYLSKYCRWAVVTLGANGCIAKHGQEVVHSQPYDMFCRKTVKLQIVRVPAIGEAKAVDATGAGDLFTSGFLYGLVKGLSLEECCKVGSCSGGAVIRSLGGEVTLENWEWMYKQMQSKGLPLPDIRN